MNTAVDPTKAARELLASHLHPGSMTRSRLLQDRDWREATVRLPAAISAITEALAMVEATENDSRVIRAVLAAVGRFPGAAVEIARAAARDMPQ